MSRIDKGGGRKAAARPAVHHALSRTLAASVGAYGFTATVTAFLAWCLPLPRAEATTTATLLSILVCVAAVVWAFGARSVLRVWLVLGGVTLLGLVFAAWRGLLP